MKKNMIYQLGAFVVILLLLDSVFALHLSIVGSVLLTVVLSLAFSAIRKS